MKQTIEINFPEGYEYSHMADPTFVSSKGVLALILKKKQTKDFSFYVDEYLRSDCNTTNDMLCNWLGAFELSTLKQNLKENKLEYTPWEARLGLLKFICKDIHINAIEAAYYCNKFVSESYPLKSELHKLKQICPVGFLESIIR